MVCWTGSKTWETLCCKNSKNNWLGWYFCVRWTLLLIYLRPAEGRTKCTWRNIPFAHKHLFGGVLCFFSFNGSLFLLSRVQSFVGAAAGIILLNIRGVAAVEPLITFANHCSSLKCLLPRSQWSIVFFHYYIPAPSKGKRAAFLSLSCTPSCALCNNNNIIPLYTFIFSLPCWRNGKIIFSPRTHGAHADTGTKDTPSCWILKRE